MLDSDCLTYSSHLIGPACHVKDSRNEEILYGLQINLVFRQLLPSPAYLFVQKTNFRLPIAQREVRLLCLSNCLCGMPLSHTRAIDVAKCMQGSAPAERVDKKVSCQAVAAQVLTRFL